MHISLMKDRIHRASMSEADLHYEGSISVNRALLEAAGVLVNEQGEADIDLGPRFDTYVIEAPSKSGIKGLNAVRATRNARVQDHYRCICLL